MGKFSRKAGGTEKLSRKEKQELKKDGAQMREQIKSIVYPTLGVIFALIVAYVYMKTRQIPIQTASSEN